MELIIGSHVSFNKDKQMLLSVTEALGYKANTFMFYTGAPQNTKRVELDDNLTKEAIKLMSDNNIDINNVVVHAPYIINPANSKNRDFNISFLRQEISRAEKLGITKLVLHPGSHVGLGEEEGIKNIINALNIVLKEKEGPIGEYLDYSFLSERANQSSFEKGEKEMVSKCIEILFKKAHIPIDSISLSIGGDLSNQIALANLTGKDLPLSFIGVYSACSTMILGMILSSVFVNGNFANRNSISKLN